MSNLKKTAAISIAFGLTAACSTGTDNNNDELRVLTTGLHSVTSAIDSRGTYFLKEKPDGNMYVYFQTNDHDKKSMSFDFESRSIYVSKPIQGMADDSQRSVHSSEDFDADSQAVISAQKAGCEIVKYSWEKLKEPFANFRQKYCLP